MSADEMPWNSLNDAAEARLHPGLAGRVLAEAGRLRAESNERRRSLRITALCAVAAVFVLGGYHQFFARAVAEERLAQWGQVAHWADEFAAN